MDAVRLEGTAGSGAPVVDQNGAPLGDQGLLEVVFRQGTSGDPGIVLDTLQRFLVIDQLFPKRLGQDVFGQVVTGGAQAAGGDDDVGPAPGQFHRLPGALGVVPHHRVPKHVQTQGGQPLGEHLCVGVGDAAQQQLGANRQDLDLMRHKKTTFQSDAAGRSAVYGRGKTERTGGLPGRQAARRSVWMGWDGPYRLTWTRSMPSTAAWTMASMSRACSAASTSPGMGRRRGWRGVNTVQQSS